MTMLDGAQLATDRLRDLRSRAAAVRARRGHAPRLGILAFGDRDGQTRYARGKVRAGSEAGLEVEVATLPWGARVSESFWMIHTMAASWRLDGLFVQFPYPDAAWAEDIERAIPEGLDVDVMSTRASSTSAMTPRRCRPRPSARHSPSSMRSTWESMVATVC